MKQSEGRGISHFDFEGKVQSSTWSLGTREGTEKFSNRSPSIFTKINLAAVEAGVTRVTRGCCECWGGKLRKWRKEGVWTIAERSRQIRDLCLGRGEGAGGAS